MSHSQYAEAGKQFGEFLETKFLFLETLEALTYSHRISVSLYSLWRRQWHPTPVLLTGKSHGLWSLVGRSPWDREESVTTEGHHFHFSLFTFLHGRSKWQPAPVFLPGESQGWGSLVGCRLWGCTESNTTEATQQKYSDLPLSTQNRYDRFLLLILIKLTSYSDNPFQPY